MDALARLVFRLSLGTLPRGFRERNRFEMESQYADELDVARRRGVVYRAYVAVRGILDVIERGLRMRAGERRSLRAHSDPPNVMESTLQDLRLAARSLVKAPGFTTLAVVTLAFGIGATTSIFSLVNAVLFRAPAHVENPHELVAIGTSDFSGGGPYGMSSHPDYRDFRDQTPALADAIAFTAGIVSVQGDDGVSEIFVAEFVTGNYFEMLGVPAALGRTFSETEGDYASGATVAVLSHGLWTRRFGSDPGIVGRTINASGLAITIIGVTPEGFGGALPLVTPELWVPVSTQALIQGDALFEQRGGRGWFVQGRLAEGATVAMAQEQLTSLASRLQEEYPGSWTDVNDETRRVGVVGDVRIPAQFKAALQGFAGLLLVAVSIVLLIACANVANLTLARASRRGREVSLKVALGAGRGRVIRQLLAESAIVGLVGGLGGAVMAVFVMRAAESFRPLTGISITLDLGLDATVFFFGAAVTTITVLAIGLVPALKASRPDLVGALKDGHGEGSGPFRWYALRNLLVISQVSASLVLLVGAGLFLKSLRAAVAVDPGFQVEGVATLFMALGPEGYSAEEAVTFFEALEERVARLPGVEAAAVVDALPMAIDAGRRTSTSIPGYEPSQGEDMEFQFHSVGPGFMETLGMEVILGREFDATDNADAALVVMVNETFAERFWPGERPIGKRVAWSAGEAEVVGLVRDAMYRDLRDEDRPAFFLPLAQRPGQQLTLVARTQPGDEADLLAMMRAEASALDARLPVMALQTMEDAIAFTLLPQRIASWLLSFAGGIGLLLAAVGLYGVMSFLVSQRTREVGVRMALGAEARHVVRMVVGRAVALSLVGALVGLGLAAGVTRFAQSLLFGVSPLDVSVFAAMAAVALVVAAFASWVPARRASTVDPMIALRHE